MFEKGIIFYIVRSALNVKKHLPTQYIDKNLFILTFKNCFILIVLDIIILNEMKNPPIT